MYTLKIDKLSKSFGSLHVIDDLNLKVKESSIFGFIGKNGTGKTTTMKMIMGFIKADKGDIYVCGDKVKFGRSAVNQNIGYLPDVPEFYGYMTPKEYLKLCGDIIGVPREQTLKRSNDLLHFVGLDGNNRKIRGFSRGMKQRLGIAQALLNQPRLLICDEPTSALDPVGRKEILDILSSIREKTTIIFSTHILSDVERVCDTIGILSSGKLVLEGDLSEIKDRYKKNTIVVETRNRHDLQETCGRITSLSGVENAVLQGNTIYVSAISGDDAGKEIIALLASLQVPVSKFEILEPDLENVFMEVIK